MRRTGPILALITAGLLVTLSSIGCATKYQMLLKDGSELITKGRPKPQDDGSVTFRDENGDLQTIGRGWVYQIQPLGAQTAWGNSNGPDSSSYVSRFQLLPRSSGARSNTEFLPRKQ